MNGNNKDLMKNVSRLTFLLVFLAASIYFLALYWKDPHIDFIPLYTVGHMWRTGSGTFYYDYEIEERDSGIVLKTPVKIEKYANKVGFASQRYSPTLFIYFPAFIPLFSIFTFFPYFISAKIYIALSCLLVLLVLKSVININVNYGNKSLLFIFVSAVMAFSYPGSMAIGWGQFTPYLFAGVYLAFYLQQKRHPLAAGLLLAAMTWTKFFPGLMLLFWIYEKDFKAGGAFIISMIVIFLFGAVMLGWDVIKSYFELLKVFNSGINIIYANQSLDSFLLRLLYPITKTLDTTSFRSPVFIKFVCFLIKASILISWLFFSKTIYEKQTDNPRSSLLSKSAPAFYLLAVMILLFPISWIHYYIFFIPLCIIIMDYFLVSCDKRNLWEKIFFAAAIMLLFMPHAAPRYLVNSAIMIFGKSNSEIFAKLILSSHLIGGISILAIANYLIYRDMQKIIVEA